MQRLLWRGYKQGDVREREGKNVSVPGSEKGKKRKFGSRVTASVESGGKKGEGP